MKLLTKKLRSQLPELYANEPEGTMALARAKFFTPDSSWYWYPSEFDGQDVFFGLVIGHVAELGYFSLTELQGIRGPLGLPVERDRYFKPTRLSELKEHYIKHGVGL